MLSELINERDHLPISEEVQDITGIDDNMLEKWGLKDAHIIATLKNLAHMMERADYLMAHNGTGYDIPMLEAMYQRYSLEMPKKVWIDSMIDIEYPRNIKGRSMALLEHAHGFVNPFPHRALTDVLAMLKVATQYNLENMVAMAESPMMTVVAKLNPPNWRNQDQVDAFNKTKNKVAKSRFRWNPSNKTWSKQIHKILIDEGRLDYDFEWKVLD